MLKRTIILLGAFCGVLALYGLILACRTLPDERLWEATRQLERARGLNGERYAPEAFRRAEQLLAEAAAEIERQQDRVAMLRRWARARELLDQSEAAARWVAREAAFAAEHAEADARQAVAEAQVAVKRASDAYARSPLGKDTLLDRARMVSDLSDLRRALNLAESLLTQGNYLAARKGARQVRWEARRVRFAIEQTIRHQQIQGS